MNTTRFHTLFVLISLLGPPLGAMGCSHTVIPNTDVEDTSENRVVVAFCEKYRHAVEDRDVDSLIAMTSPRFFETGGNARANDDIDYNGLRSYLATRFKMTTAIRYEIRYHTISEAENKIVNVDYTYTASFQIPTAEGDVWHRAVRDNRLQILREGGALKILAGM
ncbi:MAG: hypothetical protein NVS3B20_08280 [Polyangiales bacterium]